MDGEYEVDVDVLNAAKAIGIRGVLGKVIRECIFHIADLTIAESVAKPKESSIVFRCFFAVSIPVYQTVLASVKRYVEEYRGAKEVVALLKIIQTKTGKPKAGYSLDRVILFLCAHYSGLLKRQDQARMFGFDDVSKVKKAGSLLLFRVVRHLHPIKFPKDHVTLLGMENAMDHLFGLTNGICFFDVKSVYFCAKSNTYRVFGKWHGLKLGVFVDAFGYVLDYAICHGSRSDEDVFKETLVGMALMEGKEVSELGWPRHLKWRSGTTGIEPAGLYVAMDRKVGLGLNSTLMPLKATFVRKSGLQLLSTEQRNFNSLFQTGHNAVEQFFGSWVNMFPYLMSDTKETDAVFLAETIAILLCFWNLHKDIQNTQFEQYSARQRYLSNGYLAHYLVDPSERILLNAPEQRAKTAQIMPTYWMYHGEHGVVLPPTGTYTYVPDDVEYEFITNEDANFLSPPPVNDNEEM